MTADVVERLTLRDFYAQYEDRRAYLIDGVPYEVTPPHPPHTTGVHALRRDLELVLPDGFYVRSESPLETGGANDPEPDIAVVRGHVMDYAEHHPTGADALLVVEVSDSTLFADRRRKLPKYAEAGIGETWIVNLRDSMVEVYRQPVAGRYQTTERFHEGGRIVPCFAPEATVVVGRWVRAAR